ncbi:hypothetical protein LNQ03_08535 [Klebsiella pneumoniae subsp. pneumoniae]|nr:hypothetical protein [Klebsiella pneumoniae subsp. pneumoniae]
MAGRRGASAEGQSPAEVRLPRGGKGRENWSRRWTISSFTVMKGETLGVVGRSGLRQIDHRPAADAVAPAGQRRN